MKTVGDINIQFHDDNVPTHGTFCVVTSWVEGEWLVGVSGGIIFEKLWHNGVPNNTELDSDVHKALTATILERLALGPTKPVTALDRATLLLRRAALVLGELPNTFDDDHVHADIRAFLNQPKGGQS